MSAAHTAIETHYAGCRFRSRLEARWAVFFDKMGIDWEYEPQGLLVGWRLSLDEGRFPYLPDFWLPEWDVWAEVKGSLSEDETFRLLNIAAYLSNPEGGCARRDRADPARITGPGHDLVVLGPVPRLDIRPVRLPVRLHMHKGDLTASDWLTGKVDDRDDVVLARDTGGSLSDILVMEPPFDAKPRRAADLIDLLLHGVPAYRSRLNPKQRAAFTAARSARFEHGERG